MKTNYVNELLLRRKNKLFISPMFAIDTVDNAGRIGVMLKNINDIGYCFSKDLIEKLRHCETTQLDNIYLELVEYLKSYVGADREWNFMYSQFPQQVIDASDLELYANAIWHYTSGGQWLPEYEKEPRLPLFESPDLKVLDVGTIEDVKEIMNNLIAAKTSLSEQDKTDLVWLLQNIGVDMNNLPEVSFKENLPIISKLILDNTSETMWFNTLKLYYKTATDILRFAVYLSGGDVSLATNTKFKSMPNKVRRLLIQLLENCGNLEEDMLRHDMAWIKLGELLHVGSSKYKAYPKVQTAFHKLRNNVKIETFGGKVDKAIKDKNITKAVRLLKNHPGELARMLDFLIRNGKGCMNDIIHTFCEVSTQVSVPVLLQVKEHFAWRDKKNDSRVFFPKGQLAKAYTVANELEPIDKNICDEIVGICEVAIMEQFKAKEPMGKVYIDDEMKNYVIPQSQRSANSAMKIITRGSRFKLKDDSKFIRAGVHWENELVHGCERRTDIDLSCSFLDENFGYVEHISFTHLRNSYAVHSGDIVNAPRDKNGASECLDIYIDKALEQGIRYAAFQVYGYTMTKFCDLDDMLFNWQEGIEADCGDIFEPSRIQQCMNLGGNTDCEIPIVIDIKSKEIIWCDLNLTTRTNFPRCTEGNIHGLSATVMGIVQAHKPTMYDLAQLNAISRGTIVADRNDGDIIISNDLTKPVEEIKVEVRNEAGEVIETKIEEREKDVKFISAFDSDVWMSDLL